MGMKLRVSIKTREYSLWRHTPYPLILRGGEFKPIIPSFCLLYFVFCITSSIPSFCPLYFETVNFYLKKRQTEMARPFLVQKEDFEECFYLKNTRKYYTFVVYIFNFFPVTQADY
jgi:hypothetical protein